METQLHELTEALQREIREREHFEKCFIQSEEKYRLLLNNIPQKVFYKNRDLVYVAVNQAFASEFNLKSDDIIGRTAFDFFPKHLAERFLINDIRIMQSGVAESFDEPYMKNGMESVVHTVLSPVRDDNGVVIGMLGILWDITDRKKLEDALRSEKETAQRYLDMAGVMIVVVNSDHSLQLINRKGCDILGYHENEIMGKDWFDLCIPVDKRETDRSSFNDSLAGRVTLDFHENYVLAKDGSERLIYWHVTPLYDKNGKITSLMGAGEDITQRRIIETRLMTAMREADSANRAKSEFLANMSHEIRTPINGIVGLGRLMLQTELSAKQRDYVNKIQSSSNSLLLLINDLLDLSKIEAGRLELDIVDFDLNSVLDNIVNMLAIKAEEKGVEIMLSIDKDVPFLLTGDPLRITQVITNLLGNAIKFTEQGEIILAIKVIDMDDKEVTLGFSVKDTGIGIKPDVMPNLFKPFSQADSSTTRRYGGTGLGLSICRKLIELMNGEISAKSEYGKGSEFTFTLKTACRQPPGTTYLIPHDLVGMKVMVADDNESAREILKDILEGFTMEVTTVDCGMAAIEQLRRSCEMSTQRQYKLLLIDHKMPGMNGLETTRHILSDPKITNPPIIIMVTAHGNDDVRQVSRELGIRSFLTKPLKKSMLFNTILEAFGKDTRHQVRRHESGTSDTKRLSSINGARLLLVEDHYVNQQVAFELLTDAGFVVDIANNGLEAVSAVEMAKEKYGAVLMDIQMPQMDGLEATRLIREKLSGDELPIIAMTAHVMKEEQDRCYAAGMNDHISKPIDIKDLCDTLLKWIPPTASEFPVVGAAPSLQEEGLQEDNLPGIDVASGLKRLGGKRKLLQKVIIDFRNANAGIVDDIEAALRGRDYNSARDLAHGLKGMASNISATALVGVVRELEDLLKKEDSGEIPGCLKRMTRELHTVFESAHTLEILIREKESLTADSSDEVNELGAIILQLQQLLQQNSLQVRRYFAENRSSLMSASSEKEIDELGSHINKLDFKGAMLIVRALAESLNIAEKEKILIVDDAPSNIEITNDALQDVYTTYFATNARDAFEIALSVKPDLILLDIIMPEVSGYELCRRLKGEPSLVDVPIIFLTSMDQRDDEAIGLKLGAVDYISKPVNPDVVRLRVKNHLTLKRQMQKERQLVQQLTKTNTELQELQGQLLRSQKDYYSNIINSMQETLIVVTQEAVIEAVNMATCTLLGYGGQELIGKKIDIICHLDLNQRTDEATYQTKNGTKVAMLVSFSGCTSVIDNSTVVIIVGRDITEQKHKDRLFLMKMRQAQMGEMLSLIAHQWRQPLATINAIIATLKVKMALSSVSEDDISEGFDKIEKHVSFLSETINDFRNFYKTNKRLEPALLHDVIEKSLNIIAIPVRDNHVQINYDRKISSVFQTYPNELMQVFLNIFSNSLEAVKERNVANPLINISEDEDDDHIYVRVTDNGGGFSDYVLGDVFKQYFSTKGEAKGTGLGLYICKVIIDDNLKGHIEVSNVNDGACISIRLPKQLNLGNESV
ncbi:MAG: response regulator [Nitrospirae bacterium]|uniref:response regulator n=1 Tax=Candidatus Magnetobacterium casense TaxID=1455061 RepID=UPI0006974E1D|nr:response regulator [Candidatus Magnetobacterium casensis]MBF0337506.1 response regulator [Nitrospirota bacterium]